MLENNRKLIGGVFVKQSHDEMTVDNVRIFIGRGKKTSGQTYKGKIH